MEAVPKSVEPGVGGGEMEQCPRCGPTPSIQLYGDLRLCMRCNQYRINFDRCVSESEINDMKFSAPFRYDRSLIYVPGVAHPVTTIKPITQSVMTALLQGFIPRDSDVWISTYPKSGTTWMQNVISYLLYNESSASAGIAVGLTEEENIWWLEAQCGISPSPSDFIAKVNALPTTRRRCFKTHSPLGMLEPLLTAQSRVIHVARNPKDVAVSLWHHSRSKDFGYEGPFDHFLEKMFVPGHVESGSWWDFVLPYCKASARSAAHSEPTSPYSKVTTVWYEQMMDNAVNCVLQVAAYLDVPISVERAVEISEKCAFSTMKEVERIEGLNLFSKIKHPTAAATTATATTAASTTGAAASVSAAVHEGSKSQFSASHIRKGGSGGWREYFTVAQNERFDQHHAAKCDIPTYKGLHLAIHWGK